MFFDIWSTTANKILQLKSMPKIYIIGIVLVLLVGGFFFFQGTSISEEAEQTDDTSVPQEQGGEPAQTQPKAGNEAGPPESSETGFGGEETDKETGDAMMEDDGKMEDLPAGEAEEGAIEEGGKMEGDGVMEEGGGEGAMEESVKNVIVYSDTGYAPKEITIQAGETVTFANESTRDSWPASAKHPTHTEYPGSGFQKCGSGEVIFDACKSLNPGEEWSFTFNEVGEWGYHNHRRVADWGMVIVQ